MGLFVGIDEGDFVGFFVGGGKGGRTVGVGKGSLLVLVGLGY